MMIDLSEKERRYLRRISDEPWLWLRENFPEAKAWEDELFDLVDVIKAVWSECREYRINLCFAVELNTKDNPDIELTINRFQELQKLQNSCNSSLIFVINLRGNVVDQIDVGQEIVPRDVMYLSHRQGMLMFWLGPELGIYCKGYLWDPRNRREVEKEIKSKRRDQLLSMEDYQRVLDTHYEQCIRDESRVFYWFVGKKNKVLQPNPERIFQKSLWDFLNREVDCVAEMEPMFKDNSRCDVKIFLDNFDLYFVEIKWIGHCASKRRGRAEITAEEPFEFGVARAIDGAYQTKRYIEKNNAIEFDHRIKLGIYLVYDAYPDPVVPLDYGKEINGYPLLATAEYSLVTYPPSVETKGSAKRKGLV